MSAGFRIPLRFLRGGFARSALTVTALGLAVALIVAVDLANRAVLDAVGETIGTMAGRAGLQVSAGEGGLFPEDVAKRVAAVAGVELAVPVVSATAFTADERGEPLTLQGVDLASDAAVRVYEARDQSGAEINDPLVFLAQPDSIMLTRAFARKRGLALGDTIELETPGGKRTLRIRGLLEPQGIGRVLEGGLAVMDLFAAEALFARPGVVNRVDVVVRRDADETETLAAVRKVLPPGLDVDTARDRTIDVQRLLRAYQGGLRGVALLGFATAFLIAFNRFAAVFEARAWQLGVMRAVGVRRRAVTWELVKEGLLLGTAGTALGIPLGIALGQVLRPVVAASAMVPVTALALDSGFLVEPRALAGASVLGLGTALVAAVLPARRAAALEIGEIVRHRDREIEGSGRYRGIGIRVAVAAGIAYAVVMQSLTRSAPWGLVAVGLIALATALAARPALVLMRLPLLPPLRAKVGPAVRFAAATALEAPRRTALTVGMIGVGLGCVLWLVTAAESFERSLVAAMSEVVRADLVVSSANFSSGVREALLDESVAGELAGLRGVAAAVGVRLIDWSYQGERVTVEGIDAPYFRSAALGRLPLIEKGNAELLESVAAGDAAVVSSSLALAQRLGVGDSILLRTPTGPLPLRVAAITSYGVQSPRGVLFVSRELVARRWNDSRLSRVYLRVAPGSRLDAVRSDLARGLGRRYRLRALSAAGFVEYFAERVRRVFAGLLVVAAMVFFAVLVGLADTLAAGVLERSRHLAAVRAIGLRRGTVRLLVLVEGLLIGIVGVLLAVVCGVGLGILWVDATFPYLVGFVLDLYLPYRRAAELTVASLAVCLVAGLLPAAKAARLDPADALRSE